MSISEIKDFTFENYYKKIGFSKKISYNSMKHLTKKKDLLSLTNKLKNICLILVMSKNTINHL